MSNSSIWPIERALSGAKTAGQSGPGSNGNKGVLHIPQISKTGASPLDGLMPYPENLFGGRSYSSAEMQLVYSTAPANRTDNTYIHHPDKSVFQLFASFFFFFTEQL